MLTDIEDNKTSLTIRGNYKDLAHAKLAKEINSAKQNFFLMNYMASLLLKHLMISTKLSNLPNSLMLTNYVNSYEFVH